MITRISLLVVSLTAWAAIGGIENPQKSRPHPPQAAGTTQPVELHVANTTAVGMSPWGPDDELGALNRMTDSSRAAVLARIDGGRVYDLGVEYKAAIRRR
jgi:hypothetical protein